MDEYRKAEVCLNGHPTTGDVEHSGEHTSQYCSDCGAKTIRVCSSCQKSIRGSWYMDTENYGFELIQIGPYTKAPAYCHACGNAYPWTQTALDSAKELVEELDQLDRNEKDKLNGSIGELVQDSPKSQVAAVRFKKLMEKAGGPGADAMRGILVNFVSEAIKKLVF